MSMRRTEEFRELGDPKRVQAFFGYVDEETGEWISDHGRTKQEFKEEADINRIVNNILQGGVSDWLERHEKWVQQAGDTKVPDLNYRELMTQVAECDERFMQLPSAVRAGFKNDPAVFLDFIQSEGGEVEIKELIKKANPIVVKAGSLQEGSKPKEAEKPKEEIAVAKSPPSGEADPPG